MRSFCRGEKIDSRLDQMAGRALAARVLGELLPATRHAPQESPSCTLWLANGHR